jgi:hypothetical protein
MKENAMKIIQASFAIFLLLASTAPARADFKYTETTQMTGGSLLNIMKFASKFSRGDTKKQEQDMLAPQATTHYVKGGRLRTDHTDGTTQIIDVESQRVIFIDNNKKTYAVATFDQIRAAMEQAMQQLQQVQTQPVPQQPQPAQNPQVQIKPVVTVTPGAGTRVILNVPTNETKVEIDLVMQCANPCPDAQQPGQPNPADVSATYAMKMDTFVAPSFPGSDEFAKFYRRMGEEVSWMKLPATNMQTMPIDPRVTQGMSELQKNSDALRGFPMLSYVTMTIAATVNGQTQTLSSQNGAANQQATQPPPNPPPAQTSPSPNPITNPTGAAIKSLGGLFGKKKQQDSSTSSADGQPATNAPPPNPNSDPNALMEMTTQVSSYSDSSLDGSLFDIPAGYMQLQEDPMQVFGGVAPRSPQPPSKK